MLKIEKKEKKIELNGEEIVLNSVSAKLQADFSVRLEKEKDPRKQVDIMIDFAEAIGLKREDAEAITIDDLQQILNYVSNVEKK